MTTDERIDALTQSVELLSQMHQDNEKRYVRYFETISESMKTVSESLKILTRIADSHETRITDLESRDTN